jgi:pimeloyl-ACP methyl ester carboxylesterase
MLVTLGTLLRHMAPLLTLAFIEAACAPDTSQRIGGETRWINVAEGQLKTQVFVGKNVGTRPVLVLILHGDIPRPPPDYQYLFAQLLTQGLPEATERSAALRAALGDDWDDRNIVAAGVLRPGYADPSGERSSGVAGRAIGDNYTPQVVDAVATAARDLKGRYAASAVILVGHSGGGAIVANVLGRHPDLADGALLVACGCDPEAWRARMRAQRPAPMWDERNPSLMPLTLVDGISRDTHVRLLVGEKDDVAIPEDSRRYAAALQDRGIDARLTVAPGLGHNILMTSESFREMGSLVKDVSEVGRLRP